MDFADILAPRETLGASVVAPGHMSDERCANGHFDFKLLDNQGQVLWEEGFDNLLPTLGLNQLIASGISSTAYMGLISSVGFSTLVAADTMLSHAGWNEAQNSGTNTPAYGTTRPTIVWSTPTGGIVNAGTSTFVFTSSGTVEGGFICNGAGASATVGNTGGVLFSEGTLATAAPIISGYTLLMTYTLTV